MPSREGLVFRRACPDRNKLQWRGLKRKMGRNASELKLGSLEIASSMQSGFCLTNPQPQARTRAMILRPRKASVPIHEEDQKRERERKQRLRFDEILKRLERLKAWEKMRLHHLFDDEEIQWLCAPGTRHIGEPEKVSSAFKSERGAGFFSSACRGNNVARQWLHSASQHCPGWKERKPAKCHLFAKNTRILKKTTSSWSISGRINRAWECANFVA